MEKKRDIFDVKYLQWIVIILGIIYLFIFTPFVEPSNLIIAFVGMLATFVVINNHAQVEDVKGEFKDKILKLSDLEKMADELKKEVREFEDRIFELEKDFEAIDKTVIDQRKYREKVNRKMKIYTEECKAKDNKNQTIMEKYRFILKYVDGENPDHVCKYLPENIQGFLETKFTSQNPAAVSSKFRNGRVRLILEDADFIHNIATKKEYYGSMECEIHFLYENESDYKLIFIGNIDFEDLIEVDGYAEFGINHIYADSYFAEYAFGESRGLENPINSIIDEKIQEALKKEKARQKNSDWIKRSLKF